MKANYDSDDIELSEGYINALKKVLVAKVEMMRASRPEDADSWYWGRATVLDLASAKSVEFVYGSEDDMPDDGLGRFAVVVAGA